ncbi:MAG: hypothetical protein ACUVRM_03835 [Bacillota bacterium]
MNRETLARLRSVLVLAQKELGQNLFAYMFPLPFLTALFLVTVIKKAPLVLGPDISVVFLVGAAILAMVYGLQAFGGEADRKTLDFLCALPIAPWTIIVVKYLLNLGIYALWLSLFRFCLTLDLSRLALPKGVGEDWIILGLFSLLSMGFLAGLLTRGAERLLASLVLTGGVAMLCYALWSRAFKLVVARYYWFDIPPHIYGFTTRTIPVCLFLWALSVPPVFAFWYLKGRRSLLRFRPFRHLVLALFCFGLLIEGARATLGPAIWPLPDIFQRGVSGDWHVKAGVALAGPSYVYPSGVVPYLAVARIGGRARIVYRGTCVHSPRWSPDGRRIAFVDDGWIMVLDGRRIRRLVRGVYPWWGDDGRKIVYVTGEGKTRTVYSLDLATRKRVRLLSLEEIPLGLAWDARRQHLYIITKKGFLKDYALKSGHVVNLSIPSPVVMSMQNPGYTLAPDGRLLLSLCHDYEFRLFAHVPGQNELTLLDQGSGHELSSLAQVIISPTGEGFLYPRIDGAYEYKGFVQHEHHHDHEHGEEDHD